MASSLKSRADAASIAGMAGGLQESARRPTIHQATSAYEAWLGRQMPLVQADLKLKHARMAESPFAFLRATFYRWRQLWPEVCSELASAPDVLGVGDLHVENFGTWRDREGRLAWGVNDFDEACWLPYANDLVRLAASARLAARENQLLGAEERMCETLLAGYQEAMSSGGGPGCRGRPGDAPRGLAIALRASLLLTPTELRPGFLAGQPAIGSVSPRTELGREAW